MADLQDAPGSLPHDREQDTNMTEHEATTPPPAALPKSFTSPIVQVDDHDDLHAGARPAVLSHV